MAFIEINQYNKVIKGQTVLKNINLKFEKGMVYGFWGRNGSGKTMLFRAISGLIYPTTGTIIINNQTLHKEIDFPNRLGLLIENPGFYPNLSGFENLSLLSEINRVISKNDILQSLKRVELFDARDKSFKKYSSGMKQRLGIAQALMESPEILILDEPTNALDEAGIELLKNIVEEERGKGNLILLSSHNKEDLQLMSDVIYHMNSGEIIGELG